MLESRIHTSMLRKSQKKIQYSEETYGIPVLNCLDIDSFTESVPLGWNFTVIYYQLHLIKCPKRDILQINCPATNEIARSIRFVNSIPTQVSCEYFTSLEFHLFLSADSFNAHTELLNIFWNATLVPLIPISFFKHVVESFIVQFVKNSSQAISFVVSFIIV